MLQIQQEYLADLNGLIEALEPIKIPVESIQAAKEAVASQEIIVPVVGEFSAGKSTLLNSFIGECKPLLPTAITPETALATELRFDRDERIEAIGKDGGIADIYRVDEFEKVNALAERYSYLRLYLNNENIRRISPIILVDMPGFESPLDAHNAAIRRFLNKGTYFIVLVSATDGTLKNTSLRHLGDILEYERDFSIVISKANLVPHENAQRIARKVAEDIDMHLGLQKEPVAVGQDGQEAIRQIVTRLNPERLFSAMVLPDLKNLLYQLSSTITVKIAAFNKDTRENDAVVAALKAGIQKVEKEETELKESARSNLVEVNVQAIVNAVGNDLSNAIESLVEKAVKGGSDALASEISDIVHSSLVSNVKHSMRDIGDSITSRFSVELTALEDELNGYLGSDDFIQRISDGASSLYDKTVGQLATIAGREPDSPIAGSGTAYTALTSILAITTDIIAPIFEVLIVFLPSVLGFFTKQSREQQQREKIRTQILVSVIPDVKRKLALEIPTVLEEHVNSMIEEITERYAVVIEEKQQEIERAEAERQQRAEEIDREVERLQNAKEAVARISSKIYAEKEAV